MIPDTFIQELLERVDVADVVGRYVNLRKAGANLLGLCPFHNEKSPSFTVSPTKQFYHCFGCGAHGTALRFLMEHQGASFPEAVRQLADSVGLRVPEAAPQSSQRAAREARREQEARVERHSQALEAANRFYRKQLRDARPAVEYLKKRGLSGEIAARYGLGWAPGDRQALKSVFADYDDPTYAAFLVECGLVIESDDGRRYDRFRQRVTFPIRNARGHLVGFGGRLIAPGEPKYLNSPETPVFSKGTELYGLWEARQAIRTEGQVVVVEGYMDVVALAQMEIGHAVATLGTATTAQHVQKLLRVTHQIVFSFDGDKAGRKAAWRAMQSCLPLLRDDTTVRFLFLPADQDPDSYVREHGAEAFREALQQATPLSRFLLDEWSRLHDLQHAEGRAQCVRESRPVLQAMADTGLRLQIVRELAEMVRLLPDELEAALQLAAQPSGPLVQVARAASPAVEGGDGERPPTMFGEAPGGREPRRHAADAWPGRSRRSPVLSLPQRLLRLLLAYPQLAGSFEPRQLRYLDRDQGFGPVLDLLTILRECPASHTGAVLEAVAGSELEPELTRTASYLLLMDDLPEPEEEWRDGLRSVAMHRLLAEQRELAVVAGSDAEARARYVAVTREIASLKKTAV